MKIVAISDSHDNHRQIKIPDCDVLVVAGDFTCHRDPVLANYVDFNAWLGEQKAERILVVAGNHDTLFEKDNTFARSILTNCTYLEDSGAVIQGINFWGSPWTPFWDHWAFMKPDEMLEEYWNKIPEQTDVLITHGPPLADARSGHVPSFDWGAASQSHFGSFSLLEAVDRICPKLHIFGHAHQGNGRWRLDNGVKKDLNRKRDTWLYNVAICDDWNRPKNEPTIIEI